MAGYSFLQGAVVLLAAGLINRLLGFFYQIAMIRLIGPEGVGLFNMVFPIYIMVLVLATAGIPLAIAKLVAEEAARNNMRGAYRIFKLSLVMLVFTSMFFTLLLILGAPFLKGYVFPNPKVYYCFLCLIPGITIVSLCSAFRGFFQGLQQMTPTAVTQTIEQLVRVAAGLTIAYFLLPFGIEYAAVGLSLGVVTGELTGFILMLRIYRTRRPVLGTQTPAVIRLRDILTRIFNLAVPVTLTRFVATALMSLQAILIPKRLTVAGMSLAQATSAYGQFIGIAEALLFMPGVVTMALATALVPAMSDAMALNNPHLIRNRILDALRLTVQVGLPAAFVFLLLAEELCGVLFGYQQAGVSLRIMALAGPFLYLQQATTGILQGIGRADIPFKNLVLSSLFCLGGIYYLTAMPQLGIKGSALAVGAGYVIMAVLNMFTLFQLTGFQFNFRENIFKPLVSAIGMSLAITYLKNTMPEYGAGVGATLFVCLLIGGIIYILLMLLTGGFNEEDKKKFKAIFWF
jgi:stage V sporulation protein B